MSQSTGQAYLAPNFECIEVSVEQGFASSLDVGGENIGGGWGFYQCDSSYEQN